MSLQSHPLISQWITVRNGRLLVHTGKVDIGQRISTALTQIVHEELTIPWEMIDIAPVRTGQAPDEGMTSGSNSIEQSGHAIRCAAQTLRVLLIERAATQNGGDIADWQLMDGVLHLSRTNHRVDIIDLVQKLSSELPIEQDHPFAERSPNAPPRPKMRGLNDMVHGTYTYIQDIDIAGMLHARVIRPPHARAILRDINTKTVTKLEQSGFSIIRDGSFLALAGTTEWAVIKATNDLQAACDWDVQDGLPEINVFDRLCTKNAQRFLVVDGVPTDADIPERNPAPYHSARFERPYQMHGALAPSAAFAQWTGKRMILQSHSQGIYPLRESIADSLGLGINQVEITHVPNSGCYGHNGADDAAFEACLIAMALQDQPVLLKWTREDEHAWEPYASAMALDIAANVVDGKITTYAADVFSDTHRGRPRKGPNRAGPAKLLANRFRKNPIGPIPATPNLGRHAGMHRNLDPVYDFPDRQLVKNLVTTLPHRTSAMRCLGAAANIFALESFMDELAFAQSVPPIAFRQSHLKDPRALAVLSTLEDQINGLPDLPDGHGRGVAYAQYKNQMTRVGVAVELAVNDRGEIQLSKTLIVADSGRIVDADGLTAQLEGGFIQAASWALYEQVKWDRDGIQSRDWNSYPVIRFDNVPDVKVTLLDQPQVPSVGAGEATPGPTMAAIANAVFDATGIRMRRLPFTPEALLLQAAQP